MIATDQIRGPARRARLGRVTALRARRRGRLDAPGLRPLLDPPQPEPGALLELPDIVTPFVMETRAGALRAVGQLRSRLLRDERRAIIGIHAESVRVVTQYDVRNVPSPAALARYGATVGAWRADAEVCRARASALTHEANQRLACYWDAVWLTVQSARAEEHRRAVEAHDAHRRNGPAPEGGASEAWPPGSGVPGARRPGTDAQETWDAQARTTGAHEPWGAARGPVPDASAAATSIASPVAPVAAGRTPPAYPPFTARPEHWLPGRVTLDASWDDIDAWLLVEGLSERSPRDRERIPAVARALEILDTQGRRGRAGAGSERPPGAADHHGRGTR
ncbi:hypothetical protein ACFC0N_26240 [Streptomyces zaomyceticus]|uniref:hypothetical protein n=1 Tax=Streptomyces zaomyceticus TaxID=68286 RepID=UPI0035DB155D